MRRPLGSILPILATCALLPVGLLSRSAAHGDAADVGALLRRRRQRPRRHAAAVAITSAGARRGDTRTVIVGGGFSLMAALLAVHGLTTPGMLVGNNGLIAVTGAATLPAGGVVMALSALPPVRLGRASIPRVIALQAVLAVAIVVAQRRRHLDRASCPACPAPRSAPAIALFAVGLCVYGALAVRAMNTFLLTRRAADFAVVVGIVLLACVALRRALPQLRRPRLVARPRLRVVGIAVVGASLVYDLRRGRRSRALVGDLRAAEIVASEEAYLGARVRALMVRLAEKDTSTEEHTRRVAALAVEIGEQLGLSPHGCAASPSAVSCTTSASSRSPTAILQKPGPLDDDEFALVKLHPERGRELLSSSAASTRAWSGSCSTTTSGSTAPAIRAASAATTSISRPASSRVCDVYDALVSPRVYRAAGRATRRSSCCTASRAAGFDARCVRALEQRARRDDAVASAGLRAARRARASRAARRPGAAASRRRRARARAPAPSA